MSHTLDEVRAEYDRLDRLCGVDTTGIALGVSKRAVKRLGSCKCLGGRPVSITISDFVMNAGDDAVFWDTVRHEYAHALVQLRRPRERHGHDALWKAACREVGCRPERCTDVPLPAQAARREERVRYRLACLSCGAHWDYLRRSRTIKLVAAGYGRACTCPHCGGHRFRVEDLTAARG